MHSVPFTQAASAQFLPINAPRIFLTMLFLNWGGGEEERVVVVVCTLALLSFDASAFFFGNAALDASIFRLIHGLYVHLFGMIAVI